MSAVDRAVGEEVWVQMRRRNMAQKDLATRLGVSQSAVSKKLSGVRPWSVAELYVVSDLFRVPPCVFASRVSDRLPAVSARD